MWTRGGAGQPTLQVRSVRLASTLVLYSGGRITIDGRKKQSLALGWRVENGVVEKFPGYQSPWVMAVPSVIDKFSVLDL